MTLGKPLGRKIRVQFWVHPIASEFFESNKDNRILRVQLREAIDDQVNVLGLQIHLQARINLSNLE